MAAFRNAVAAGLDEVVASRAASLNPARLLGIDGDVGTIEVGKRADLVVLDDAREVVAVIVCRRGRRRFARRAVIDSR